AHERGEPRAAEADAGPAMSARALVAALALCSSALAAAEPIHGVWTAGRTKWRVENGGTAVFVQLSLQRSGQHGSGSSSPPVPIAELSGLTEAQVETTGDVRFTWKRDAGTFALEGRFQDGDGAGHFAFTPSPEYQADMKRRGYGAIDDEKAL